jgi:hypothetical protein
MAVGPQCSAPRPMRRRALCFCLRRSASTELVKLTIGSLEAISRTAAAASVTKAINSCIWISFVDQDEQLFSRPTVLRGAHLEQKSFWCGAQMICSITKLLPLLVTRKGDN